MNSLSRSWRSIWRSASTVWLLVLSFFEWLFSATSISQARGFDHRKGQTLLKRDCCTWEDWKELAATVDKKSGRWKARFDPISDKYDYSLIERCTSTLKLYRTKEEAYPMLMFLRSSLLRNFGNIGDSGLYTENYSGTKILIEDYVREVNRCLEFLFFTNKLSIEEKHGFYSAAKISFGTTCLYFNGGTAFGLYHFGVAKALWERDLLPRVLAGSASGALIAAFVGVHRDEELDDLFQTFPNKLWEICKNISMIASFVHKCVGDLTFQEAFEKTNRAINIIAPPSVTSGSPQVLNYHTAPNVLIWSAACASNSWAAIYRSTSLLAKSPDGTVEVCTPENFVWPYASMHHPTRPNPYARISDLFNVNHFIITQSRPSLFPTFHDELYHHTHTGYTLKMIRLFGLEMAYRFRQMDILGLLPIKLRRFLVDDFIPSAYITLTPTFSFSDIKHAFTKPSLQDIQYWILVGERATWQAIPLLQIRCKNELSLNNYCEQIGFSKTAKIPLDSTSTPFTVALEESEDKLLRNFKVK
ncbi:triacylglycerol lipase [Schizosaccharomyces octosporus yFS286]|uniref:Triacylglycerol lipase n=1 Tax=Schizosaccharomyces octosporus (strain yFS286) TaxID=483514 RepID=S9PTM9_SCHOY|nr:triacylglycerol lipase [Schizosaccharomyces octosporus yFS286]EPX70858.1 triacylglycerol lipase [Schizosaccharomyces octosporus yFS286]